jgi:hypothetical protein
VNQAFEAETDTDGGKNFSKHGHYLINNLRIGMDILRCFDVTFKSFVIIM